MAYPRNLLVLFVVGALAPLTACTAAEIEGEAVGTSEARAVVTQEQADRAFAITKGIDYLPWGYTADGCYARALYMSMELAAERIPSSAEYVVADTGAVLSPGGGVTWGWHVAPMIKITATGTPLIIDPSLFQAPEQARSLDTWVERNNPIPSGAYHTYLLQGSTYWATNHLVDTTPIGSFAELDPFHGSDIESACSVAFSYLGYEQPLPAPNVTAAKRSKLVARTRTLVDALNRVGKLDDLVSSDLSCGGHALQ